MRVRIYPLFCSALLFALLVPGALVAEVINYQGRLSVDGVPLEGQGLFRFALVDTQGQSRWSSGEMRVPASAGRYAVRLGDSIAAPSIDPALLQGPNPARLRISFSRNGHDWAQVGADIALVGTPPATPAAGNAEILSELRAIHSLLAGGQRPAGAPAQRPPDQIVTVAIAGAPSLGSPTAPLVLVEFTDFQCPFCMKFQNEVFARLKTKYVDSGRLRIVSMHLPLPFHPLAAPAARAAMCADAQGKFWEMRERLFAAGGKIGSEELPAIIKAVGLDEGRYALCAASPELAATLTREGQDAKAAGIEATPTFVLGTVTEGKVTGLKMIGAQPPENFEAEINRRLERKG